MSEQEKLFYKLRDIGNKISDSASFIQNDFDRLIENKELNLISLLKFKNEFLNSSIQLIEDYRDTVNHISRFTTKKIVEHFDTEIS